MNHNLEPTDKKAVAPMAPPAQISASREIAEIEGAIVLARKFPRNEFDALSKILEECKRTKIAEKAMYSYKRGGELITGPSIRLAEICQRYMGNIISGTKEIGQDEHRTWLESYSWDLETNSKTSITFSVPHIRYTRKDGRKPLVDPRDIYDMGANWGARRRRACILASIPGHIIDAAVNTVKKTLAAESKQATKTEKRHNIVARLAKLDVPVQAIEDYLNHAIDICSEDEIVHLHGIANSIEDGAPREDYFNFRKGKSSTVTPEAQRINEALKEEEPPCVEENSPSKSSLTTSQTEKTNTTDADTTAAEEPKSSRSKLTPKTSTGNPENSTPTEKNTAASPSREKKETSKFSEGLKSNSEKPLTYTSELLEELTESELDAPSQKQYPESEQLLIASNKWDDLTLDEDAALEMTSCLHPEFSRFECFGVFQE